MALFNGAFVSDTLGARSDSVHVRNTLRVANMNRIALTPKMYLKIELFINVFTSLFLKPCRHYLLCIKVDCFLN